MSEPFTPVTPVIVDAREGDLAEARAELGEARRQDDRLGGFWPRNPATAPVSEAELDALEQADDAAITQALAALDALLTRAVRHKDLPRRSRQLARVDRALADPETGYLRRLRELRTATLRERRDAGASVTVLAAEAGVSTRRIHALLTENTVYVSDEMRDARAQVRADRAARAAAAKGRREAERRAALAQGAAWAARVLAGERVSEIAAQEGVTWQRVANAIKAANRVSASA